MSLDHEVLQRAYEVVVAMAANHPDFIGFDDHHAAAPDTPDPPIESPRGFDRARQRSLTLQKHERERRLLDVMQGLGSLSDPGAEAELPYFLCCLSPETLIRYANEHGSGNELQTRSTAGVLVSRIVHDAGVLQAAASRGSPRTLDEGAVVDLTWRIAEPVMARLQDRVRESVGERLVRSVRQQQQLSALQSRGGPGLQGARGTATFTVIVHGTWAADTEWWRDPAGLGHTPTDSLWAWLQGNGVINLVQHPDEFSWSGKNSDAERRLGAEQFVAWWHGMGRPLLDVVAHSHGGNLVMRAQAIEPSLQVRRLVLLGTPARYECPPVSRQIGQLSNVFSDNDTTQHLGSLGGQRGEGRTQSDHPQSVNLYRPTWQSPGGVVHRAGHSDLHEPDFWRAHRLERLLQ